MTCQRYKDRTFSPQPITPEIVSSTGPLIFDINTKLIETNMLKRSLLYLIMEMFIVKIIPAIRGFYVLNDKKKVIKYCLYITSKS